MGSGGVMKGEGVKEEFQSDRTGEKRWRGLRNN